MAIKIIVDGKNVLIPRGYGIAPRKTPFAVDYTLLCTMMTTPGLTVFYVDPETNALTKVTRENAKKIYKEGEEKLEKIRKGNVGKVITEKPIEIDIPKKEVRAEENTDEDTDEDDEDTPSASNSTPPATSENTDNVQDETANQDKPNEESKETVNTPPAEETTDNGFDFTPIIKPDEEDIKPAAPIEPPLYSNQNNNHWKPKHGNNRRN